MLVTILALASVAVVRNLSASVRTAQQVEKAGQITLSGARVMHLLLNRRSDWANWRSVHTSGQWYHVSLGDETFYYRFVDETDGVLADDATQPVRLYVRTDMSDSRRVASVVLRPEAPENLLANGGFERGLVGWRLPWSYLTDVISPGRTGDHCALVSHRDDWYHGITQDVDPLVLEKGQSYEIQAWVRTVSDAGTPMKITLALTADGTTYVHSANRTVTTSWRKLSGTVTADWSGTLTGVRFYVENSWTGEEPDYRVDDCVLRRHVTSYPLTPEPGTWRAETLPADLPDTQPSPLPGW
jgi:hypothetical protein